MRLFLQTSSGQPSLVLWDEAVLFEVNYDQMQRLDYGVELAKALKHVNRSKSEIENIIVDIGPGRLGSTRTAVAFANGLGFALGVPIQPINSFDLIGRYAELVHGLPCLILRSAARRQYHWALVQNGQVTEAGFAENAVIELYYKGDLVIAGDATPERVSLDGAQKVTWLALNAVPGSALAQLAPELPKAIGPVVPLVDTSGILTHG